jgi:hypothetical protein
VVRHDYFITNTTQKISKNRANTYWSPRSARDNYDKGAVLRAISGCLLNTTQQILNGEAGAPPYRDQNQKIQENSAHYFYTHIK